MFFNFSPGIAFFRVPAKLPSLPGFLTDIDLWLSFTRGDMDAFGELFKRHYSTLLLYGTKLCPDRETVEDCIQELFVELWQGKPTVTIKSVKAYLLTSVKYKLFRVHRDKPAGKTWEELNENLVFEISHDHFLVSEEDQQLKVKNLVAALSHLTPRQREIVYLRIYQGLEYEGISEVMGINYQVARNLFSQSIKSLRKHLTVT